MSVQGETNHSHSLSPASFLLLNLFNFHSSLSLTTILRPPSFEPIYISRVHLPISHIELDSLSSLSHSPVTHDTHTTHHPHTLTLHIRFLPLFFLLFPISTLSRPDQKLTPHFLSLYATTCPYFPPLDALHRRYKGKLRQPPSPLFLSHPSCERGTTGPILHSIIFFSSSSIRELVLEDGRAQPKATSESTLALSLTIRLSPSLVTQPPPQSTLKRSFRTVSHNVPLLHIYSTSNLHCTDQLAILIRDSDDASTAERLIWVI